MMARLRVTILFLSLPLALNAGAQTGTGNKPAVAPKPPASAADSNQISIENSVERYLRNVYAWGPSYEVKIGTIKPSPIPELMEVPVTISKDGQSDTAVVY